MYTQCPKCQTVFHITLEQLKAHSGVVRCGQCDHVFNADQQLFDEIPLPQAPAANKPRPSSAKARPAKAKAAAAAQAPARKPARASRKPAPPAITEEVDAAPPPWSPPTIARTETRRSGAPASAAELSVSERRPSRRRFSVLWLFGIVLLAALLGAQAAYFYRDQLLRFPEVRPYLVAMCTQFGCDLQPPYDAARIELVQPTNIAPHARFANALRLRATLVNRAERPQLHPLMHVTLTDSTGGVLSRRTFAPAQYLEQRSALGGEMPPHLAVSALLDLVNPNGKAVGYQIDFSAPPMAAPPAE